MSGFIRRTALAGACLLAVILSASAQAAQPRVLLLGPSVQGGATSWEAQKAAAQGFAVDVVTGAQWDAMTTAQFKRYRALIIGDNSDSSHNADVAAAESNAAVWGAAIDSNIILSGADPEFHASNGAAGAQKYIDRAIAFATAHPGHTGFYFAGTYYYNPAAPQHVKVLDGLTPNGFYWVGGHSDDTIHIDPAAKPPVPGLTDSDMSNWHQTAHMTFTTWPSSFHVWAVGASTSGNWTTSDGVKGYVHFLVSTRYVNCGPSYNQGYNQGYVSGFQSTYNSRFNQGYQAGYQSGFQTGFQAGYHHTHPAGDRGAFTVPAACVSAYNAGYSQGHNVGSSHASSSGAYNRGYSRGYTVGYQDGYNKGSTSH